LASAPQVVVLGSTNTDLVIVGARLPGPGETVTGGSFFRAAGGKGANQAVAAARAGARVTFLGAVGDDEYGRAAHASLAAETIDVRFVKTRRGLASGVALILVDACGENMISVAPGANAALTAPDIEQVPPEIFAGASVLLASLESPLDAVASGLRRARGAGVLTILNPAPATPALFDQHLLEFVDVIVPNRSEAALLTGCDTQTNYGLEQAARALCVAGCGKVVITLGGDGCFVYDSRSGGGARFAAKAVQAVDATAAGDTFCGALAVALGEGRALASAVEFATAAAAISVTRRGAQPSIPTRAEIEQDC
jgi:ribokinase